MILVRCIKNVYGEAVDIPFDFMEARLLFKVNNFYMADQDKEGHLMTQDEEGEPHIIADSIELLSIDSWFHQHFVLT
ncbi:hypothetical protein [Sporolactobacillus inulinus]|jgi:hypothetical protein|uniref:Uncharacterized protein n=2 Tax=Sporolactobacillus inulinus TaxID=2078 RepID=A0A0U1QL13_9BACL|nr:hypothetical protein [Sporolactobacillus inulinus]KLI01510.1 hypothetical protein SINU_13050 [Sporolactobacillus inulinus CASD]GEB78254.1 hypothetical protein SIN01_25990 [Sporolactobacillus inulinus]